MTYRQLLAAIRRAYELEHSVNHHDDLANSARNTDYRDRHLKWSSEYDSLLDEELNEVP